MRFFSAVAAFGFVAVASAQSTTDASSVVASITSTSAPASSASLTTEQKCLNACGRADLCCQAACVGVPCPNDLQANQTTDCAGQCVQGNGSEEETSSYAACQQSCISSLFFPLSATAGGAGATGTGAGSSDATATGASETGIGAASGSGSGDAGASASATGSTSGNSAARTKIAGAGLLGLVIVGLAL